MRLIHKDPTKYINRTIIAKNGIFWLVKAVHADHIELEHHSAKGKLLPQQWQHCRPYPELQEVATTYPRLINLLRQVCLLTHTEAEAAIQGHFVNGPFCISSEAVARLGGTANAIRRALMHRHRVMQAARRERARALAA